MVPSTLTAWNEVDPTSGEMVNPVISPGPPAFPGGSPEAGQAIFAAYGHEHPVLQHIIRTGDGRPHAISDFLTQEEFHATQLYQQFYRPLGVEEQMALQLPSSSPIVAITLHAEWREFTERDRVLLNLIRPQLVQSMRNARAFDRLQRLRLAMEQRIEDAGEGMVLLDHRGRVDYASPNARAILARWLGEWRRPVLPDQIQYWIGEDVGAEQPAAPPWPLVLRRHRRQLTIRRLRVPGDSGIALLVTERSLGDGPATVLARLGLTPRQSQVLELAIRGTTNGRIAAELGISAHTVEAHMTSALAKLGVDSRTAAANLVHQAGNDPG